MTTPPTVANIRLVVTYAGRATTLDMDVGISPSAGPNTRALINEAVANLIRLLMEATE